MQFLAMCGSRDGKVGLIVCMFVCSFVLLVKYLNTFCKDWHILYKHSWFPDDESH